MKWFFALVSVAVPWAFGFKGTPFAVCMFLGVALAVMILLYAQAQDDIKFLRDEREGRNRNETQAS